MAAFGSLFSTLTEPQPAVAPASGGGDWFGQFGGKQGVDFNGATMGGGGKTIRDIAGLPPGAEEGMAKVPMGQPVGPNPWGIPPNYVKVPGGGDSPGMGYGFAPPETAGANASPSTSGGAGATGGDPWQSFESILGVQQGGTLSPQMLLAKENDLKAAGITLIKNAAGLPGKVQFSNGAAYDVIQGAGAGQNIYQRLPLNAAAGGSSGGGGMGSLGGFGGMTFQQPSLEDARNSPGYQFAQQQGMDAIQKSAAARGNLLTGGTLKALQGYGTGLADQTYGNVFSRALQTNQNNTGNLFSLAKLGMPQ